MSCSILFQQIILSWISATHTVSLENGIWTRLWKGVTSWLVRIFMSTRAFYFMHAFQGLCTTLRTVRYLPFISLTTILFSNSWSHNYSSVSFQIKLPPINYYHCNFKLLVINKIANFISKCFYLLIFKCIKNITRCTKFHHVS